MQHGPASERSFFLTLTQRHTELDREQEANLARRWLTQGDEVARDILVHAHLRSVVIVARSYRRYNTTLEELIAEGSFGLLRALSKFDPDRGYRFITYAVYWVRAYILAYLERSRSLVSSGVNSKQFAKLRRGRAEFAGGFAGEAEADVQLADRLGISADKLRSLSERMNLHDVPWESDGVEDRQVLALSAEDGALSNEFASMVQNAVSGALTVLDDRERYIIEQRVMAEPEDQHSLAEIGRRFGVSRERARQIERRAKLKLKRALASLASDAAWGNAAA